MEESRRANSLWRTDPSLFTWWIRLLQQDQPRRRRRRVSYLRRPFTPLPFFLLLRHVPSMSSSILCSRQSASVQDGHLSLRSTATASQPSPATLSVAGSERQHREQAATDLVHFYEPFKDPHAGQQQWNKAGRLAAGTNLRFIVRDAQLVQYARQYGRRWSRDGRWRWRRIRHREVRLLDPIKKKKRVGHNKSLFSFLAPVTISSFTTFDRRGRHSWPRRQKWRPPLQSTLLGWKTWNLVQE